MEWLEYYLFSTCSGLCQEPAVGAVLKIMKEEGSSNFEAIEA